MQVQAAPLEGVPEVAGVVAGEEGHGGYVRPHRAELRNGDLVGGEDLEQEGLELLVRLVDLVDEKDRSPLFAERPQQGPRLQERFGEEDVPELVQARHRPLEAGRVAQHVAHAVLQDLGIEELLAVLPLVEGLRLVEPLVALEPDEGEVEKAGHREGELGLADAGRALDEDRLLEMGGDVDRGRDGPARDIVDALEPFGNRAGRPQAFPDSGRNGDHCGPSGPGNARGAAR